MMRTKLPKNPKKKYPFMIELRGYGDFYNQRIKAELYAVDWDNFYIQFIDGKKAIYESFNCFIAYDFNVIEYNGYQINENSLVSKKNRKYLPELKLTGFGKYRGKYKTAYLKGLLCDDKTRHIYFIILYEDGTEDNLYYRRRELEISELENFEYVISDTEKGASGYYLEFKDYFFLKN